MKKSLLLALISFLLMAANGYAQFVYDVALSQHYYGFQEGFAVASDDSGNVYATGYFSGGMELNPLGPSHQIRTKGADDIYIAKYYPNGLLAWGFDLGSSDYDEGLGVKVDAEGGVYLVGRFHDTVDFDPGPGTASRISKGDYDIFLAKYSSSNGALQWVNTVGGAQADQGWDVAVDPSNGNVLITGVFVSDSINMGTANNKFEIYNKGDIALGGGNCFVAAYNGSTGACQWAFTIGGFGGASGTRIVTDNNENFYVSGDVSGDSTDFDPGPGTHWVYNTKVFTTSGNKIFVAKYSSARNLDWVDAIGGIWGYTGTALAVDNNGGVYLGGYFNADTFNVNPGADTFYLRNTTFTQNGYMAKYNSSDGHFRWGFSLGGKFASDEVQNIAVSSNGHFFITGEIGDSVDFDPSPGKFILSNSAFLAEYDTAGHFVNAMPFAGDGGQTTTGICMVSPTRLAITGTISSDSVDFDPGAAIRNLYGSPAQRDAFVAIYGTDGSTNSVQNVNESGRMDIYPNPASESLTLSYSGKGVQEIVIRNVMGEIVYQSPAKPGNGEYHELIDASVLAPGMYFVELRTEEEMQTAKFIKQ